MMVTNKTQKNIFPVTNKVLAVWGSPNSGKTVTALKLANELSKQKKNVVIVLCDLISPALPTLLKTKTQNISLGAVLSAPALSQELVLQNCIAHEKNPYISLLGYKAGENAYSYADYTKERAVDMLVLLRHIADYVIVDCSSNITDNILSTAALEVADEVLRLCSCDLKSLSYFISHLQLIADPKFKPDKHIKVLSNLKAFEDSGEYSNYYGGAKYQLPYVREIENQSAHMRLFDSLTGKVEKEYESVIAAIVKEVFGNGA
jgi:MinD-like ATPase involved in chromosome partitioning or flagellar assembly